MAVCNCDVVDYHWALCWNITISTPLMRSGSLFPKQLIANRTRCGLNFGACDNYNVWYGVISNNRYSYSTISRKDFHYIFEESILRDCTPSTYYYLAGVIDGDGCIGKNTLEITMHANEIALLHRIKALFNGSVSMKGPNSCRWRLSKNRKDVIDHICDKVLTKRKQEQLLKYYGINCLPQVNIEYMSY